jgi:dTMP kinase
VHSGWSLRPDRTFLLVLPVEEAVKRLSGDSLEHFERAEVLEKVQAQYLALVDADPERFILIDALKDKKEIAGFVASEIRNCAAPSRSRRPRA